MEYQIDNWQLITSLINKIPQVPRKNQVLSH